MDPKYFVANQELDPGPTTNMLSKAAGENGVYIFGGKGTSLLVAVVVVVVAFGFWLGLV